MARFTLGYWLFAVSAALLFSMCAGAATAVMPTSDDPSLLLKQADSVKTSNHPEFVQLLQRLDHEQAALSSTQKWDLRYLHAWESAFDGDYDAANSLFNAIIDQSNDVTLRFRAAATSINVLGDGHHYEQAFARLSWMLDQLPKITDTAVRYQGLGEASQLLIEAGQYDLATDYADQMLKDLPVGEGICKSMYFKLHAHYRSGELQTASDPMWQVGLGACVKAGESVIANAMRTDAAELDIQQGRLDDAISLLQRNYPDVLRDQYSHTTAQFQALLAQAYWKQGNVDSAKKFALTAVDTSIKSGFTEALSMAYEVLYQIDRQQGDLQSALDYHEKYMAADKGYLDDVSAKTLAYQIVKQQVLAKKQQVDALNNQNQILQLQQALDRKAVETSRLSVILLLTVLVFIGLWLYRLKRSQLRFMGLARQDGLTGIFNRQHFVNEAEQALRLGKKLGRTACFILIDLDNFKLINDNHGHALGDLVLKRTVTACQKHLQSSDIFGRLGGEEFGILLPVCAQHQVVDRAERIRQEIAALSGDDVPNGIVVSASFGIASTDSSGYDLRQLLVDADSALYRAKRAGRNRIVLAKADDCLVTP